MFFSDRDQKMKFVKQLMNMWGEAREIIVNSNLKAREIYKNKAEIFPDDVVNFLITTKRYLFIDVFIPSVGNAIYTDPDPLSLKQNLQFMKNIKEKINTLENKTGEIDFVCFVLLDGFDGKITGTSSVSELVIDTNKEDLSWTLKGYLDKFGYSGFNDFRSRVIYSFFPLIESENSFWDNKMGNEIRALFEASSYFALTLAIVEYCIARIKLVYLNQLSDFSELLGAKQEEKKTTEKPVVAEESNADEKKRYLSMFEFSSQILSTQEDVTMEGDQTALYDRYTLMLRQEVSDNVI